MMNSEFSLALHIPHLKLKTQQARNTNGSDQNTKQQKSSIKTLLSPAERAAQTTENFWKKLVKSAKNQRKL